MTRRPYHRPPEGRHRDRADRRAVVDVLLARAQRGALSPAEGALLAEHTREEMRLADENRKAMVGTTQALERVRAQLAAAEAAIVEAERDRDQAEQRAKEAQRVAAEQHAAVTRVIALVGRHNAVPAEAVWAAVDADPVEHRTADDRARRWKDDQGAARAAVDRVRVLAQRMRAGSPQGAAAIYADRIEQALDNDRRALDPDTEIRARILDAADSPEARLAEQKREHDVALATMQQRMTKAEGTLSRILAADTWGKVWTELGLYYGMTPEEAGRQARRRRTAAERAAQEAEGQATAQRRRANGWREHALAADDRGDRYRLAWLAARRDRKADRAAMRADLATMQAAEQQLAAVRAALPTEPRPRLGLPTDLAYANGRHDLADAVRDALDTHQPKEHPTA